MAQFFRVFVSVSMSRFVGALAAEFITGFITGASGFAAHITAQDCCCNQAAGPAQKDSEDFGKQLRSNTETKCCDRVLGRCRRPGC